MFFYTMEVDVHQKCFVTNILENIFYVPERKKNKAIQVRNEIKVSNWWQFSFLCVLTFGPTLLNSTNMSIDALVIFWKDNTG